MSATTRFAGGCLCGAVRWEAKGEPDFAGYCFCADCRKASGSGFVPFMGFESRALRFHGSPRPYASACFQGTDAVRNFCPACGGLVFGGQVGTDDEHTIYAGSLDDPSLFRPTMAIFARDRPDWVPLPPGLDVFDTMPG